MRCRHCNSLLEQTFLDLGSAPPSNAYLSQDTIHAPEKWYPLRVMVCTACWLVQTEDFTGRETFFNSEYAYFSSFSTTWLAHVQQFVKDICENLCLDKNSHVIEVAANDGYLLQFFQHLNIPCTGIEPTASTAESARNKGLHIIEDFFSVQLAKQLRSQGVKADLIIANNVLAHVPDINDFLSSFPLILKPDGIATFEFPYIDNLIREKQFDTIYHEHFSYFSLTSLNNIFKTSGLLIFDVIKLPTHGGSLRIYATHTDNFRIKTKNNVIELLNQEENAGVTSEAYYLDLQNSILDIKCKLLEFLLYMKMSGKKIAAYGAAAKGNTLLNYSGIKPDLLPYVVDKNPVKQGKYLPGSRIPILTEEYLKTDKPDYVIILPWNIREEINTQLQYIREWGGKFVTFVPEKEIF